MPFILWFDKVGKDSLALAGGKGANLGEMTKIKLPVPPGFVITTESFDRFLEANKIDQEIDQIIKSTNVQDTNALSEASEKIKRLIVSAEIPIQIRNEIVDAYKNLSYTSDFSLDALKLITAGRDFALVAVRSSATAEDLPTASFAGQQKTFLNVKGISDYLTAVKEAWASLFEPRAIYYRNVQKVEKSSIALVVQRMVNSEKAGVMFTVNPTTGEENIVIEATWGLGENLVSGEVEPDTYILSRDGNLLEKRIGRKEKMRIRDYSDRTVDVKVPEEKMSAQVLTEDEMRQLVNYGLTVEQHYGRHQDIEYAIEKGKVYLVQTRAVTTQAKKETAKESGQVGQTSGNVLISGLGSSPGVATGTVKIVRTIEDLAKVQKGDVLVTKMTSPDMVVAMGRSVAIVTDEGGLTAHASIVGREMGLPVIVGTKEATTKLQDGQKITVDAFSGKVYEGEITVQKPVEQQMYVGAGVTSEFMVTSLKVNMVFAEHAEEIAKKVDGVGLLRIEHMVAKNGIHPAKLVREGRSEEYIKVLMDGIRPIAQAFNPKPVWLRTLDARSDEFRNLQGGESEDQEANPMLGWHGIRRSIDEPGILKAELTALKRLHEEGLTNILVMFPFIISVDEFRKAKQIGDEVGFKGKYGIMVETPACALIIEDFCKEGIVFASFGSNDMTQLTLGIDRGDTRIQNLFSEKHPAMKKIFKMVIDVCRKYNVESSICGEGPSNDQELVEFLVDAGIDSISVNMDAIDKVRSTIIKSERKLLLEAVRNRKA
jgi:pyruvate,water dikinase